MTDRGVQRVYSALVKHQPEAAQELPDDVRANLAPNGLRHVLASALQSSGDQTVNAATVLPWLFAALGVPPALTGVLVPIRESGSMLPQAFLTPLVLRVRHRKWIYVVGALVQALAVATMAATAALGAGLAAGLVIITALAVFATGRSLCSIASKDVQGRTIPKGQRGQINGLATTAAGVVAITLGVGIRILGGGDISAGQLAWVLGGGAALWVATAVVYSSIREPDGQTTSRRRAGKATGEPDGETASRRRAGKATGELDGETTSREPDPADPDRTGNWFTESVALLREDKPFRHFVGVRSLLLVSSLSPPFIVTLSIQAGADSLAGLGGFVIASGIAALIGGRIFGRLADRSSRRLMSIGAGVAAAIVIATVALVAAGFTDSGRAADLLFVVAYFLLTLMHTGVRVGRKTYIVDMAEGDLRTKYVAVSNSAMGLILLVVGGVSSLLAVADTSWALLFLAAMGLVGVLAGARLPDVSRR